VRSTIIQRKQINQGRKLGAHLSIAGNILNALHDAQKIQANTLQIFSGPPRNWQGPKATKQETKTFRQMAQEKKISPVFVHAKYLINIANSRKTIREKSIISLIEDLKFCQKIGAYGVIFHPHPHDLPLLFQSLRRVLAATPPSSFLILENSAQTKLEEIGQIIRALGSKRIKFCLDLAHAFQAGYDLTTSQGLEKIFTLLESKIGYDRWVAVHANDSQTHCGSRYDRHEDIARGKLGTIPFFVFLNHPFAATLPFIIETPAIKTEGLPGDIKNLNTLKKLVGRKLGKNFYQQPTVKVAQDLLGKYLIVKRKNSFKIGKIVETEAYVGPDDQASHAFKGKTPRTKIMFGPAGRLYVYLIWGMYHCLNIVTEKKGYPAAVLLRAVEPVFGIQNKTDGPGKLCREFGFTRQDNGLDITSSSQVYLKDIGEKPLKIKATPRIGVDYAGKWAKKKWRFVAQF